MHFSSVLVCPILVLQFCVRTLRTFLSSVFSKVPWQTALRLRGESPTLSPVDGKVENATVPTSVNYHFTRKCNYKCGFCFHTAKTSFVLPLEEAMRGLKLLKESGEWTPEDHKHSSLEALWRIWLFDVPLFRNRHGEDQLLRRGALPARKRRLLGWAGSVLQTGPPTPQCQHRQQWQHDQGEVVPEVW